MARPLRIEYPGATYHVVARGNERSHIYTDDHDREGFLSEVERIAHRLQWQLVAYCLMGNHYHLLVRTANGDLCRGMRNVNGVYAQAFNRRHQRVGHLFQGRYKAILVEDGQYLQAVGRYILRNPVRAGICPRPQDWPWSSYNATLGHAPALHCLDPRPLLLPFGPDAGTALPYFRTFVEDDGEDATWDPLAGRVILGSDTFSVEQTAAAQHRISQDIPQIQRDPVRPHLAEIITAPRNADQLRRARHTHGYRIAQIAAFLGCHPSTVSRALRAAESEATANRGIGVLDCRT